MRKRGSVNEKCLPFVGKYFTLRGTGFEEFNYACEIFSNCVLLRVAGWLIGCLLFCDAIDSAQQCSVSQVISGDIDGGIHRHSCCVGFGCWFFLFEEKSEHI